MADEKKRTGREPDFDTDRAWERFAKLAAREPVPAFWKQSKDNRRSKEIRDLEGVRHFEEIPQPENIRPSEEIRLLAKIRLFGEIRQTDEAGSGASSAGMHKNLNKGGAGNMKQTEGTQEKAGIGAGVKTESAGSAEASRPNGAWRTEKPIRRRLRRLAAGAVAAAMVIGLMATPLGDRALAAMQQTFRIQHMVGVGISADDMTAISNMLNSGSPDGDRDFNLAQYGTLTQSGGTEAGAVSWEEAEKRMNAPLLRLDNTAVLTYQSAATLTFRLNVEAVNRLLTRLGGSTTLPAEADGKAIRLHIPDGISAEGTLSGKPVQLLQFGKPELTVEGGIDPDAVREAVLGLPVLPDSLRTKLAAIGDWKSTLPVPAKAGVTTSLRLHGHDAVMTEDGGNRYLLWLDGERMGLLSGSTKEFPAESAFQRAAEELVRP